MQNNPYLSLGLGWGGSSNSAVDVLILLGDSQMDGAYNALSELATTPIDYTVTDLGVKIWDVTSQAIITKVPGALPQPAALGVGYPTPIGFAAEYARRYRRDNPTKTLYIFQYAVDGSRFLASGTAGKDWIKGRSGGIYASALSNWTAFKAALTAQGRTIRQKFFATSLGWNSALNDSGTEAGNYATDFATWMTNVYADFIDATTPVAIMRMQPDKIGSYTAYATIRSAQASYVAGNSYARLVNCDGSKVLNPVAAGNQHYTAAGHIMIGRQLYWALNGLWYPQSDFTNPPTAEWHFGDLQNTLASSAYSTLYDSTGNGHDLTQGTAANRPAASTLAASGLSVGVFDGSNDSLWSSTAFITAQTSYGMLGAMKLNSTGGATYALVEGNTTLFKPFNVIVSSGTGTDWLVQLRNDAATFNIAFNTVAKASAYNGAWSAIAVTDDRSTYQAYQNGSAGSAVSYTRSGTFTFDRLTLGSIWSITEGGWGNFSAAHLWITTSKPDATYLANARAFLQREYGTP